MALRRMDNVGIVVEDLAATIEFFREIGLELEGQARSNAARRSRLSARMPRPAFPRPPKPGQPDSVPSSWLSQSSVLAKRLCTTRTTQMPPPRASTLHSSAMGGEPPQPSPWAAKPPRRIPDGHGGTGLHARAEVQLHRNGLPVALLEFGRHEPGRNTRPGGDGRPDFLGRAGDLDFDQTERRPEASYLTLMMAPWDRMSAAEGGPRPPGDARGRRGRIHRGTSKPVS